jgi:hypothetical protein
LTLRILSPNQELQQQADNIATVDPGMMLATVIYTLLLGIFFIFFGLRVHKFWVIFWGVTMVLAGGAYLIFAAMTG